MKPRRIAALAAAAAAALLPLLWGCSDEGPCEPRWAVVTDIDETLTATNGEWLAQVSEPTHDPVMRPDANALMSAYAELGYCIAYVTARGEDITLPDGRTARDATRDWLVDHDFPFEEALLFLAPDTTISGSLTVERKAAAMEELQAEGWSLEHAYGNADTDIEAYRAVDIPDDRIYLVGRLAGTMGVVPVPDDEAFTAHLAEQMPTVPEPTCH